MAGTGQSRSRQPTCRRHRRRLDETGRTGRVPARWSTFSIPNSGGSNRRRPARPGRRPAMTVAMQAARSSARWAVTAAERAGLGTSAHAAEGGYARPIISRVWPRNVHTEAPVCRPQRAAPEKPPQPAEPTISSTRSMTTSRTTSSGSGRSTVNRMVPLDSSNPESRSLTSSTTRELNGKTLR